MGSFGHGGIRTETCCLSEMQQNCGVMGNAAYVVKSSAQPFALNRPELRCRQVIAQILFLVRIHQIPERIEVHSEQLICKPRPFDLGDAQPSYPEKKEGQGN